MSNIPLPQEETDNKLIAEFMLLKPTGKFGYWINEFKEYYQPFKLKYHSSWDWLMPVVEKIESLDNGAGIRYKVCIESRYLNKKDRPFAHCVTIIQNQHPRIKEASNIKIEAVWIAVVKFITWYNNHKQ